MPHRHCLRGRLASAALSPIPRRVRNEKRHPSVSPKISKPTIRKRNSTQVKKKARHIARDEAVSEGDEEAPATFKSLEISEEGMELIELIALDCAAAEGVWHSDAEIKIDKKGHVIRDGVTTNDFWNGAITAPKNPCA